MLYRKEDVVQYVEVGAGGFLRPVAATSPSANVQAPQDHARLDLHNPTSTKDQPPPLPKKRMSSSYRTANERLQTPTAAKITVVADAPPPTTPRTAANLQLSPVLLKLHQAARSLPYYFRDFSRQQALGQYFSFAALTTISDFSDI